MLYPLDGVRKSFGTKDVLKDAAWQHDHGRIVGTGIHHVRLEVDDVNLVASVHPASTGDILLDLSQEMEG